MTVTIPGLRLVDHRWRVRPDPSALAVLDPRVLSGHAEYVRWQRASGLGVRLEQAPQRIRDAERAYQRARHQVRVARKRVPR